jgi:hypothetical protein
MGLSFLGTGIKYKEPDYSSGSKVSSKRTSCLITLYCIYGTAIVRVALIKKN